MINANKKKKKSVAYESYATNIRIKGMAIVLCKMPYEKEHGDPEIVEKIIGDALEFYFMHKQQESAADKEKSESAKKDIATDKI